tara:strand:- start:1167 stop:1406 length:240 start_codon:yes stop_codon:yes gene_type:complete
MIAYFNKQLIALEEEQKASNSEVLKLASIQNQSLSKSTKNAENVISRDTVLSLKKLLNNKILAFLATASLLGILALNFF